MSARWLAILLLLLVLAESAPAAGPAPILECRLKGVMTAYTADFLQRVVASAPSAGAQAVLVTLDTPGGLLDASKEMVQTVLNSSVPVIVYVSPSGASASSAGTFLTIAAHVAAMAPGTNIGAAHPVTVIPMGEEKGMKTMMEKVTNDTVSYVKSIATLRGRDAAWVEKAVRESVSITANEALEKKIVDLLAEDKAVLLKALDGRVLSVTGGKQVKLATVGAPVQVVDMTAKEKLFSVVADPNIAYLLLLLGIVGIVFEVTHPGTTLPGVVGVVSMGLAMIAFKVLPLSYTGLLMLLFGIAFLVLEAMATTHGVLGVGGVACLAIGSYLLFDAPASMRVSLDYITAVVGTVAFLFLFLLTRIVADLRRPVVSGREGMVGGLGLASGDFAEEGLVAIEGEVWKAVNGKPRVKVAHGDRVRVLEIQNGRLVVERVE
jgi:membrane-bound serine protease (ClpP class)